MTSAPSSSAGPAGARPWAVVPVKPFDLAKSRLGEALDDVARRMLARTMFDRVIGEALMPLVASGDLAGTVVVTSGDEVAARAVTRGAEVLHAAPTGPGRPLATLVDEALAALARRGAAAALVIMGDLPRLEPADVRALAALLDEADVVLAPDDREAGTNALGLRLPAPMPTRFKGGDSLGDHLDEARARGLRVSWCRRPGLQFDIDNAADYARLHGR